MASSTDIAAPPAFNVTPGSIDEATCPVADYARVSAAVQFLSEHLAEQPSLDEVAGHIGLNAHHFHKLFSRWAGVSPKQFVQALTLDHAKALLRDQASLLDASYAVGLSGAGRLHDLFIAQEAMTPGSYKRGGEGLVIAYGFHPSPFGLCLMMRSEHGLVGLAFAEGEEDRPRVLADMTARWPKAAYVEAPDKTAPLAGALFGPQQGEMAPTVPIVLIGTDFEIRVWRQLMQVKMGEVASYGEIARAIGAPKACRAVGRAIGHNPLSFVVPCHRAVGSNGKLTGYHWGLTRKRVLLGWEAARLAG